MPCRGWTACLLARSQRAQHPYPALGCIGKGVGHEGVVAGLAQPQLEDAAAPDRDFTV